MFTLPDEGYARHRLLSVTLRKGSCPALLDTRSEQGRDEGNGGAGGDIILAPFQPKFYFVPFFSILVIVRWLPNTLVGLLLKLLCHLSNKYN